MLERWGSRGWSLGLCSLVLSSAIGCGGGDSSSPDAGMQSGGSMGTGGEGSGGSSSTGGMAASGGTAASGGSAATGGQSAPTPQWPVHIGDPAQVDVPFAVIDGASNLLVGATTEATVRLGDGETTPASAGGEDALLVSFDSAGALRWSKTVGSTGADSLEGLAVAPAGDVYVVVSVGQASTLDGEDLTPGRYLFGLTPEGVLAWNRRLPSSARCSVAADSDGNAWVGCGIEGAYNAGGDTMNQAGGHALMFASYGSDGSFRLSSGFVPETDRELTVHAMAPSGRFMCLYAAVALAGIDVGGGVVNEELLLACFDQDSSLQFSRGFSGTAVTPHMASDGDLLVITDELGRFRGPDFGSGAIEGAEGATYVAALDASDGSEKAVYQPDMLLHSAEPDGDGGLYVAGRDGDTPFLQHLDDAFAVDWTKTRADDGAAVSRLAVGPSSITVVDSGTHFATTAYAVDGSVQREGSRRPWLNATPQSPVGIVDVGGGEVWVGMSFDRAFQVGAERRSDGLESLGFGTFDMNGALASSISYGSSSGQTLGAVGGDSTGTYAVGRFRNRLSFGSNAISVTSGYDAFVAAFDGDGQPRWAKRFGLDADDMFHTVTVAPDGGVIAGGTFGDRIANFTAPYFAVVSLSDTGEERWITEVSSATSAAALSLAADDSGVYAVGRYKGTSVFGELQLDVPEVAFFATHLAPEDGSPGWVVNGTGKGRATAVALDNAGDAYVAGSMTGDGTLCGEDVSRELMLVRLNAAGACTVVARAAGSLELSQLVFDGEGALWGVGWVQGSATLGTIDLEGDTTDALVVRFDASTGKATWARRFGGGETATATGITVSADGVVHVTGTFRGAATIGFDDHAAEFEADATGDGFVIRFEAP